MRPTRLRLVRQLEIGDCAAACLAMVLRAHGVPVRISELRDLTDTGREGASARGILVAASHFGFAGQGVRCPPERLGELPPGTILHWEDNHFVVLLGRRGSAWRVLDPALGARVLSEADVAEGYSGVALLLSAPEGAHPAPELSPVPGRWATYRRFLAGAGRPAGLAIACAAVVQLFAVAHPLILQRVVDGVLSDPTVRLEWLFIVVVIVMAVSFAVSSLGRLVFLLMLQRHVDYHLTFGVLQHLVALPYAFLARRSTGDLAMRLRSTLVVRDILTTTTMSALLDGALVLGYLAVLASIDSWFAAATALLIGAQVVVVTVTWRRLSVAATAALAAETRSQERLLEIVSGLELLKATGAAPATVDAWASRLRSEVDAESAHARLTGLIEVALGTVRFATPLVLLALGTYRVGSGALDLADMLAIAALAAAVTVPVGGLLGTLVSLTTVVSYLERLDDLLHTPTEPTGRPAPPRGAVAGAQLDGVTFSYSALAAPALRDVSLTIEPGEFLAVVGPSGSGKSTLAMVLATLYPPASGVVRFGGVDALAYDGESLRRRLGIVTQTTTLFAGTIRSNIAFGHPDLDDATMLEAAMLAAIHADVMALPAGYDTMLGNNGAGLSGGQRQRIAIARAVASAPELLILDEATSSLDAVAERAVQRALARLGCTRVVIAHRLSTIERADRVLVLQAGEVVALGTLDEIRRDQAVENVLSSESRPDDV